MASLGAADIDLWWVDLDAEPTGPELALGPLTEDERARAEAFRFEHHRVRWARSRAALRWVLAAYAGGSPAAVRFRAGAWGKPYLLSPRVPLHFNLSRADGLAAIVVSRIESIGVDVELAIRGADMTEVVSQFYSSRERRLFRQLPVHERARAALKCWTSKEAFVKATGRGLSQPLDGFDVSLDPACPPAVLSVEGQAAAARDWTLYAISPDDDYVGTVAVRVEPGSGGARLRERGNIHGEGSAQV